MFYFTRFPDHITEKDLRAQFKRWGDVREIFILNHRNKGGRRYGFVRYFGVSDERKLERQLDNIILGGLKLYVNVPKYKRGKTKLEEHTVKHGTKPEGHNTEAVDGGHTGTRYWNPSMTYAKVVSTNKTDAGLRRNFQPSHPTMVESHSSLHLEVSEKERRKYTDTWVGHLKNLGAFERVDKEIPWELGVNIVLKYIGDDMVLLLGLLDSKAEEIMSEELQHGTSPFYSLQKWNPTMRPGHRLVWVQCWGIPLEVWDVENL